MWRQLTSWLEERTGASAFFQRWLELPIPGGPRWRHTFTTAIAFTFACQCITGFFLWAVYSPSVQTAWESVFFIEHKMIGGWLLRGLHHFAAHAMMILLGLTLLQIVIYRAYRSPREVNHLLGVLLILPIIMVLSQTGYLLPWDQRGFYGTQVATTIAGSAPVVGPEVQLVAQGGGEYGHHTLTRLFALHAGLLPVLLAVLMIVYACWARRNPRVAETPEEEAATVPYWPGQAARDAVVCLAVMTTVVLLATFMGVETTAPADPSEEFPAARPEWYFLFLFRFLKFHIVEHFGLAFGAIHVPGMIITVIALMPWIGRWKLGHAFNVAFVLGVFGGIGYLTALAMYEDATNPIHQASLKQAHADAERVKELALAKGIPVEGALSLLKNDPLAQGPRLFTANCLGCHAHSAIPTVEHQIPTYSAPDLSEFGNRDWMKRALVDFSELFAPTANLKDESGEPVKSLLEGDMASWSSENRDALLAPENAKHLAALVEFMVAQSDRADLAPFDPELVKLGRQIFETGELAMGALSSNCIDCHSMHAVDEAMPLSENEGTGAPTLTGYGGVKWLTGMIASPEAPSYYADGNCMPSFYSQLSAEQISLIARWMAGDYWRADAEQSDSQAASH